MSINNLRKLMIGRLWEDTGIMIEGKKLYKTNGGNYAIEIDDNNAYSVSDDAGCIDYDKVSKIINIRG